MLCAPRGLPVATLKKHIDGHILDLKQMTHQWEKDGTKAPGVFMSDVAKDDDHGCYKMRRDSSIIYTVHWVVPFQ